MRRELTVDEWQKAYEEATKGDPGETVGEIAIRLGKPHTSTQRWLAKMLAEAKVTEGSGLRGTHRCRVYQLVPPKKRGKP